MFDIHINIVYQQNVAAEYRAKLSDYGRKDNARGKRQKNQYILMKFRLISYHKKNFTAVEPDDSRMENVESRWKYKRVIVSGLPFSGTDT